MKKKLTFCETILLMNILLLIQSGISGIYIVYLIVKGHSFTVEGSVFPAFLGAVFLIILICMLTIIFPRYRRYRKLCSDFTAKTVYQEFISHAGEIFPGLEDCVNRLDGLLDRQNTIQLSTKQAEFLALQNQINPHFLYNTLDAIRSDALIAGLTEVTDITEALSKFFRYTITNMDQMVRLRDELENVKKYFIIQKYRFGNKLDLVIRIGDNDDKIMNACCPKLFLQPLVENAIFHGLEPSGNGGTVTISVDIVADDMLVRVSDNGIGMPEDVLHKLNESLDHLSVGFIPDDPNRKEGGIALKNVCRRTKLLFGEQYGLHMSSIPEVGTVAEIRLPFTVSKSSVS